MKRKRYEKKNDDFKNKISKLVPITVLKCDVCNNDVIDFHQCIGTQIYCSYNCYAILMLSLKRSFLDERNIKNTFEEDENDEMLLDK